MLIKSCPLFIDWLGDLKSRKDFKLDSYLLKSNEEPSLLDGSVWITSYGNAIDFSELLICSEEDFDKSWETLILRSVRFILFSGVI